MSVQFSGGEPTMSPFFLDAVRYARKVGYNSVQAATNGIEFAKSPEFAKAAAEAGLRYAYLQFDGIGNAANSHRRVGNLFDVKLRAIENLLQRRRRHRARHHDRQRRQQRAGRPRHRVRARQSEAINFLSFQPVSFTGRDEEITPERRAAQRYTLSHLAHDVKNQTGISEPIARLVPDLVHVHLHRLGRPRPWTGPRVGPADVRLPPELRHRHGGDDRQGNQGSRAGDRVPQRRPAGQGLAKVNDAARGKVLSIAGMALALMRNYDPFKAPTHFRIADLMKKFDKTFGATGKNYGKVTGDRTRDDIEQRRSDRWNFLFIAGMWFQDLFNYDFRRTEMCIIPYATQQGEISFCAYNTGIGWRNIIEKMHMTATLTKWYEEHGRHEIFAGNKHVPLSSRDHSLVLNAEAVAAGRQTDLDELGIAKNAREEKLQARKKQLTPDELRHHEEMERLYRQQVLKEQPTIQIQGLGAGRRKQDVAEVVHKPTV